MDQSKKRQIRNLLGVVLSAVLIACLFSAGLLYKYNPTGQYEVGNVLLSPEIISSLNFNDTNSKTNTISRFVFDKIEFEYEKAKWDVSTDQYLIFYQAVSNDKSIEDVTDEIKNSFNKGHLAKVKIMIRTESPAAWQQQEKSFQEIDFSPQGNYYRVQLRESDSSYAYFYHPDIFNVITNLFSKKDNI